MRRSISVLCVSAAVVLLACDKDQDSKKDGAKTVDEMSPRAKAQAIQAAALTDRLELEKIEQRLNSMGVKLAVKAADNVEKPGLVLPPRWLDFTDLSASEELEVRNANKLLTTYQRQAGIYLKRYRARQDAHAAAIQQKKAVANQAAKFLEKRPLVDDLVQARTKLKHAGLDLVYLYSHSGLFDPNGPQVVKVEQSRVPSYLRTPRVLTAKEFEDAQIIYQELANLTRIAAEVRSVEVFSNAKLWQHETFDDLANGLTELAGKYREPARYAANEQLNLALANLNELEEDDFWFGEHAHQHELPEPLANVLALAAWNQKQENEVVAAINDLEKAWFEAELLPQERQDHRFQAVQEVIAMIEFRVYAEVMMDRFDQLREAGLDLGNSWAENDRYLANLDQPRQAELLTLLDQWQESFSVVERLSQDPTVAMVVRDYARETFAAEEEEREIVGYGNLAKLLGGCYGVVWLKQYVDAFDQSQRLFLDHSPSSD